MGKRPLLTTCLRHSRRHLLRTLLLILGIAMGVAGVVAIDIARTSVSKSFDLSTRSLVARATHQVVGTRLTVPQSLFTRLRTELGIHRSAPVITAHVKIPRMDNRVVTLLGVDPFSESYFRDLPLAPGTREISRIMTDPAGVLIPGDMAREYALSPGDTLEIFMAARSIPVTITGVLSSRDTGSRATLSGILVTDIAVAQELLEMTGRISRIDVILEDDDTIQQVHRMLPDGVYLVETGRQTRAVRHLSRSFENSLTAFSMLALFMGIFLIYNTVSFSVARRRVLFGILRGLGATRSDLFATVLLEVAIYAVVGAVLGGVLGVVLGKGAVQAVCRTVSDLYFVLTVSQTHIAPATLVKGIFAGIFASLLSAFFPALSAARVAPVSLMQASVSAYRFLRILPRLFAAGVLVLILSAALLLSAPFHPGVDFIGVFLGFFGAALTAPLLIRHLIAGGLLLGGRAMGSLMRMALRQIIRSLGQTSVLVASLMVVTSVYFGIEVMTGSFRSAIVQWVDGHIGGDVHVSSADPLSPSLDPGLIRAIQALPAVADLSAYAIHPVFSRTTGQVHLFAYRSDRSDKRWTWTAVPETEIDTRLDQGWIIVSEIFAARNRITGAPGAVAVLETRNGPVSFNVAGIFTDFFLGGGRVIVSPDTLRRFWGHDDITSLQLFLSPGQSIPSVMAAIREMIPDNALITVQSGGEIKQKILAVFDHTFMITTALQILTAVVALTGILNAVMALLLERTRQIGILRACGTRVRQIHRLLLYECGCYGLISGILAIPLGTALSWVLIHVINQRSFGWTYDMVLTPGVFIQAVLLSFSAALAAGIAPAIQAGRTHIPTALQME